MASAITGRAPNFSSIQRKVGSMLRSYSQNISPRAKKFFVRSTCLFVRPRPSRARLLSVEMGTEKRCQADSDPSVRGFVA